MMNCNHMVPPAICRRGHGSSWKPHMASPHMGRNGASPPPTGFSPFFWGGSKDIWFLVEKYVQRNMICDFLVEKYVYVIFWWKNMCKTSKISKFWREHNFFWRPPRFVTTLAMPKQTRTKVGWIPSGFLFRSSEFTWQLFECVSIYIYITYITIPQIRIPWL